MEEPKALIDESHTPLDGGEHPLRPGYYHFDGQLTRRSKENDCPEVWNGREWRRYGDVFKFDHGADRITQEQAEITAKAQGVKGAF